MRSTPKSLCMALYTFSSRSVSFAWPSLIVTWICVRVNVQVCKYGGVYDNYDIRWGDRISRSIEPIDARAQETSQSHPFLSTYLSRAMCTVLRGAQMPSRLLRSSSASTASLSPPKLNV